VCGASRWILHELKAAFSDDVMPAIWLAVSTKYFCKFVFLMWVRAKIASKNKFKKEIKCASKSQPEKILSYLTQTNFA
jgi:hypothetical protein